MIHKIFRDEISSVPYNFLEDNVIFHLAMRVMSSFMRCALFCLIFLRLKTTANKRKNNFKVDSLISNKKHIY